VAGEGVSGGKHDRVLAGALHHSQQLRLVMATNREPVAPEAVQPAESHGPRLAWLTVFHVAIIALVVVMARLTREYTRPPAALDQLGELARTGSQVAGPGFGERHWLTAVVAMVGALLLMLPIAWAYVATRDRRRSDQSLVTTITLLPIAVAAILVIVRDSLAVAFSLAGIAGLVRFRNALDDPRDAMYVIVAIAVGLGAGVGALEAAAALSGLFNLVSVTLWKWNSAQPVIVDIALGEHPLPKGQSVLEAITSPRQPGRHPAPLAEWLEPTEAKPLMAGAEAAPRGEAPAGRNGVLRDGVLRVHAADDGATRREVEDVLGVYAKRWALESDDRGADGLPTLTYEVRLRKRARPADLLQALRARLEQRLAEYSAMDERVTPS
jgi:Domain of unknown function (DUF4956)